MSHYVTMIDTLMSGWGEAEGRTNIYMVECHTVEQAQQVVRAGKRRGEMRRPTYRGETKPYYNKRRYLVSLTHWDDLGPCWTDPNYRSECDE